MKLHLGCGRSRMDGWLNVDCYDGPSVDLVADLDGPELAKLLEPDSVTESLGLHVIEHLHRPLEFMQALWTVTKPGGTVTFETPYGSSDDAWEDPTHARPYFMNSWSYFGQPFYWRADYGYQADWRITDLQLVIGREWAEIGAQQALNAIHAQRNVVKVMRCTLEAVKPAREPLADLQEPLPLSLALESE